MYKKLEDDQNRIAAASGTPEAECACACGTEAVDTKTGEPEVNKTVTFLPVYYDVNGGGPSQD